MAHKQLPEAITDFLEGLIAGDLDLATSGLASSAVGVEDVTSYRGSTGIRDLLDARPALGLGGSWRVDYAMDTEFIVTGDDGQQLQFLLEGGRISYLHIDTHTANSEPLAAA
jgi:hypothetical protein